MSYSSMSTAFVDITLNENVRNENNNNKDFDQIHLLSSPETTGGNDLNVDFYEPTEVYRENNNISRRINSKQKNQKSTKRLQSKPVLSSLENISLVDSNVTILSHRSEVWKYAIQDANKDFATCCLCDDNKRISTNNGSTSTLRKHLISVHNLHHLALPAKKNESTKSSISLNKKRELDGLLVNCIIKDGRTFNDFQKAGLKNVFDELASGMFI